MAVRTPPGWSPPPRCRWRSALPRPVAAGLLVAPGHHEGHHEGGDHEEHGGDGADDDRRAALPRRWLPPATRRGRGRVGGCLVRRLRGGWGTGGCGGSVEWSATDPGRSAGTPHGLVSLTPPVCRSDDVVSPSAVRRCGCDGTWQGLPLTLDVDHIDGECMNNCADNLRFLCPNCHRQTPNFAGRSRGKYTVPAGPDEERARRVTLEPECGTGRHADFRCPCLRAWGFKSPSGTAGAGAATSASWRPVSVEAEVAAQLGDVTGGLDVVLGHLDACPPRRRRTSSG